MASFDSVQSPTNTQIKRRALIVGGSSADTLRLQLAESGYETSAATTGTFAEVVPSFLPDVVLIVLEREVDAESEAVAVARRIRQEPATHALPLVLVYGEEDRLMSSSALSVGVDDCFGIWTPHGQILARLDALFWRIEAGRRAASMSGDKRLEIDNFMVLLEAVREDIRDSASGSLALIYAVPSNDSGQVFERSVRDRTLAEAHGFFKLNLRRIDAVGFYGPTTLLVYLPKQNAAGARTILTGLRASFLTERMDRNLAIGIASFPDEGREVERLIELAEAAAGKARTVAIGLPEEVTAEEEVEQVDQIPAIEQVTKPVTDAPVQVEEAVKPFLVDAIDERSAPVEATQAQEEWVVESTVTAKPAPIHAEVGVASRALEDHDKSYAVRESHSSEPLEITSTIPVVHLANSPNEIGDVRAAAEQAAARERERRKRGATIPRRLLLTVSDAARMAQLNALVRSAGYEARTAFDGQQALDLLRIESPDVVLLDYELRGIDGLEMLRRLRKQTKGKLTVPVVMLLPPSQVMVRREALELGARGIVTMPYDPAELLDSVRIAGNGE